MFKTLEFAARIVREVPAQLLRSAEGRRLTDSFNEFIRRIRRGGLLFIILVSGLLAYSLILHPIGFLLWLIAIPLAGFGALLSMLWPTRRFSKRRPATPELADIVDATLRQLARSRGDMPPNAQAATDLVVQRLKSIRTLAGDGQKTLVTEEAGRLIGQHLPRLVESFLSLPLPDRTEARAKALGEGLGAISDELVDLSERLRASRNDRFDTQRIFIASRFPRKGLASL